MAFITELPLTGMPHIGRIKKFYDHWSERKKNYEFEMCRKFPSKNSIKVTSFLIKKYSERGQHICDPMCGIGTTLVESVIRGRNAYGFDIYTGQVETALANCKKAVLINQNPGRYKVVWDELGGGNMLGHIPQYSMDLVVYSPPYGLQNHSVGKSKKAKEFCEKHSLFSCQEYRQDDEGHIADVSRVKGGLDKFYEMMKPIVTASIEVTKTDGHICVILQDYIRNRAPVGLVQSFIDLYLADNRVLPTGYYTRELYSSYFKDMHHKRGNVVMLVEHILVFQKGRK